MPGGSSSCCCLCSHWSLMYCINTCRAIGWSSSISMVVRAFVPALTLLYIFSYNSSCSSGSHLRAALGISFLCACRLRWLALSHVLGSWVARCCCMILTGLRLLCPVKNGKKTILYGPSDRNGSLFRVGSRTRGERQRARYREDLYSNSNPRRIFSDLLTNHYVFELLSIDGGYIRH